MNNQRPNLPPLPDSTNGRQYDPTRSGSSLGLGSPTTNRNSEFLSQSNRALSNGSQAPRQSVVEEVSLEPNRLLDGRVSSRPANTTNDIVYRDGSFEGGPAVTHVPHHDGSPSWYGPNHGSQYPTSIPQTDGDNRMSYHAHNNEEQHRAGQRSPSYGSYHGSQYPTSVPQADVDNRMSHYAHNNELTHRSVGNRMVPFDQHGISGPPNQHGATQQYHPSAANNPPAHGRFPSTPEVYRSPPNNGPQYSGYSTAPSQDGRYTPPTYAQPPQSYHDVRNYLPGPRTDAPHPAVPMAFKQTAPRQRTAIACKYCRRRKIRCSGFMGYTGRCGNCEKFKQECVFTPVSSQQAFVPLTALHAATAGLPLNEGTQLYGAHGQPIPRETLGGSQHMFHPPTSSSFSFEPQRPYQNPPNFPSTSRSPYDHNATLPSPQRPYRGPQSFHSTSRSPHDQNASLPSPTGSLESDTQKRKRDEDEQHHGRMPPRSSNHYGQHHSSVSQSSYSQNQEYRQENTVPYRPRRVSPSPNNSSLYHTQVPDGHYQSSQMSPYGAEHHPLPQRSLGLTSSSQIPSAGFASSSQGSDDKVAALPLTSRPSDERPSDEINTSRRQDPMAISNFVAPDNESTSDTFGRLDRDRRS